MQNVADYPASTPPGSQYQAVKICNISTWTTTSYELSSSPPLSPWCIHLTTDISFQSLLWHRFIETTSDFLFATNPTHNRFTSYINPLLPWATINRPTTVILIVQHVLNSTNNYDWHILAVRHFITGLPWIDSQSWPQLINMCITPNQRLHLVTSVKSTQEISQLPVLPIHLITFLMISNQNWHFTRY